MTVKSHKKQQIFSSPRSLFFFHCHSHLQYSVFTAEAYFRIDASVVKWETERKKRECDRFIRADGKAESMTTMMASVQRAAFEEMHRGELERGNISRHNQTKTLTMSGECALRQHTLKEESELYFMQFLQLFILLHYSCLVAFTHIYTQIPAIDTDSQTLSYMQSNWMDRRVYAEEAAPNARFSATVWECERPYYENILMPMRRTHKYSGHLSPSKTTHDVVCAPYGIQIENLSTLKLAVVAFFNSNE